MPRRTNNRFKKTILFFLVLVLLLSSLTACKKTQPKEEGLPVLTIDGVRYPVTTEDGIKGLPDAHDGVIVQKIEKAFDPVVNAYTMKWENNLYKSDGTFISDFQGKVKFRLNRLGTIVADSRIKLLDITTSFMPVQVPAHLDEEAFCALMEENGFLKYYSNDRYSKIYTEHGTIDMLSDDFMTPMIGNYRRDFNLPTAKYDDAYVLNAIKNSPSLPSLRYGQVERMLIQELKDSTSTLYCELRITYHQDKEPDCQVILYAKEDTISSWILKWDPSGLPVQRN